MNDVVSNHLSLARAAIDVGDPARAVVLLEKARVLVGDNLTLHYEVLELLAEAYAGVGRGDEAAACRQQLPKKLSPPRPPSAQPLPLPPALAGPPRFSPTLIAAVIAGVLLLIVLGAVLRAWLRPPVPPVTPVTPYRASGFVGSPKRLSRSWTILPPLVLVSAPTVVIHYFPVKQ